MRTIIQLSDFHIKASMPLPGENTVFSSMVQALKSNNPDNAILLYNGDVIDTNDIINNIDKSLTDEEKAQAWDTAAEKAYQLAEQYFNYLTVELSIPNNRIIVCCGNHDINPYYEGKEPVGCPDSKKEPRFDQRRFTQFAKFCDHIQLIRNTWGTYFREIDDLRFLVVNTNWLNKYGPTGKQNLCVACNQIQALIAEKKDMLLNSKREKSKLTNIFVAHAPRADYCEEARYRYEENNQSAAMELVDDYFGLKLYGDKHTDNVHNFDYIVGAPLDSDTITCGIHYFDHEQHHHHKTLFFSNNVWKTVGSVNDIEHVLEISADSIKAQCLEYLFGSRYTLDLLKKIHNFEIVRTGDNWAALDRLLCAYADIQKPESKSAGTPIRPSIGFIDTLTQLISDSRNRTSITLRGPERVGKSVCMSLLYLNLLYGFSCGKFEYLPVYINVEQILHQIGDINRDSKGFTNKVRARIKEKLSKGIKLAATLQRPACCIIDGINKYYLYKKAKLEEMIATETEGEVGKQYAHYIYCIDTGNNTGLGSTPQHTKKDAEYVVYFNRVLTKKVNSRKKYKDFIKAYCYLKDSSTAEKNAKIVFENIERMKIQEVDTNLLTNFWHQLSAKNEDSYFEIVDTFVGTQIGTAEMDSAAKACFLYYKKGRSYTDLKQECKISSKVFDLIRTQKVASRYLLAANYVLSVRNVEKNIAADSCLNILYNHEICAFIRQYIQQNNAQQQIIDFAKTHYGNLSYQGKATISFLLGRIECDANRIATILDQHAEYLMGAEHETNDVSDFYRSIAQRSVRLSKAFTEQDTCTCIRDYIRTLSTDSYERKINRIFYLLFYGDRKNDIKDYVSEGFDIYYTYNILASRLEEWKKSDNRYTLLELELFTLCDLLQVRLNQPYAKSSNGKDNVASFFYSRKFNQPYSEMASNVLGFMIEIINHYLELYGNTNGNLFFNKYLVIQCKNFAHKRNQLISGPLTAEIDAFNPNQTLAQLCELGTVRRIGWNISDVITGTVSEDQYCSYKTSGPTYETTLQHTYEAYLIGLLYLPSKSLNRKKYNKQKILNMLLVHDLGESLVGDIIPAYVHYQKSRESEREFCENLFLQGARSNLADLSDYFDLWESWCDSSYDDDNVLIAKEIDRIQMLYKLLVLLQNNTINLTSDRIKDFWKAKSRINTNEGKEIFNTLIAQNPIFRAIAKEHDLSISELK